MKFKVHENGSAEIFFSEEEIKIYCKEKLTAYKCPKHVSFTDELPKSNVGKILRRIIKENDLKNNSY